MRQRWEDFEQQHVSVRTCFIVVALTIASVVGVIAYSSGLW